MRIWFDMQCLPSEKAIYDIFDLRHVKRTHYIKFNTSQAPATKWEDRLEHRMTVNFQRAGPRKLLYYWTQINY